MNFKIGDFVRIGGKIPPRDVNYYKCGVVVDIKGSDLIVDMIEPFASGKTHIDWPNEDYLELDPNSNSLYCPLLF